MEWRLRAAALTAGGALATFAFRLSMPAVAGILEAAPGSWIAGAAAASAAYMLARATAAVTSGHLYDRAARAASRIPSAAVALMAAITLAYAYAPGPAAVAGLRWIQGLLAGLTWPVVQASLALATPEEVRGRVLSIYFAAGTLAGIAANAAYAAIASWPPLLQLAVSTAAFAAAAPALAATAAAPRSGRRAPIRGQAAVIAASILVAAPTGFAFGELSYALLSEILDISLASTALLMALLAALSTATSYLLGWAADKGWERQALAATVVASAVSPLLLAMGGAASAAGYVAAMTAASSFKPLSRRYLSRSGRPGAAVGLVNAASNLGTALGQALVALLA